MKILFITGHEFTDKPQNGGQTCSLRNYEILRQIYGDENVYLCMFTNRKSINITMNAILFPTHKNNMEMFMNTIMCRNVCSRITVRAVKKYVLKMQVDICFVDSSTIGNLIYNFKLKIPIVFFFHNIEKNYAWNKFRHEGFKYIVAYYSYYRNEKKAVEIADKIILLNERDEKELQKNYRRKADYFLPISFKDVFDKARINDAKTDQKVLLFVGSLFQPNVEGIRWFVDNVMSKLEKEPFILKIVGKNLEKMKDELTRKNVQVVGTVGNLSEYYYLADAVVIPIFYGDGMKVKTGEAMMYGKIIFATDEALEGYEIDDIEGVHRCNNSNMFVNELRETKLIKFNDSVRNLFKTKYDTESLKRDFEAFINAI